MAATKPYYEYYSEGDGDTRAVVQNMQALVGMYDMPVVIMHEGVLIAFNEGDDVGQVVSYVSEKLSRL